MHGRTSHVVLDWTSRATDEPHYLRYCGTPPISHLFGLREASSCSRRRGLETAWRRHAVLAGAVRALWWRHGARRTASS